MSHDIRVAPALRQSLYGGEVLMPNSQQKTSADDHHLFTALTGPRWYRNVFILSTQPSRMVVAL
jgi:hypothetical protein